MKWLVTSAAVEGGPEESSETRTVGCELPRPLLELSTGIATSAAATSGSGGITSGGSEGAALDGAGKGSVGGTGTSRC